MLAFPAAALGGTNLLPGETREPRGARPPPPPPPPPGTPPTSAPPGAMLPPPRGWGCVCCGPYGPPPRRARGRRALPAALRERRPPPPAPPRRRRRRFALPARPGLSRPPAGGRPRLTWRGGGGGGGGDAGGDTHTHDDDDGARRSAPCRGLCLRCHMGRGAGFKRVSAGHAVSGAPQPCPQRQRSARPGMRL